MTKWNGLNRNQPPRKTSLKKQRALAQEAKVHAIIKERSKNKCEICQLPPTPPTYKISYHELIFRSAGIKDGGIVSELNTFATDDICHYILQHYLIHKKGTCLRMIIQARNTDLQRATEIYRRIYSFAEQHRLLRESKLNELDKE